VRNDQIGENIDAALATGDADLADSFVELAREKNIPVSDDHARRVSDAVAEQHSTSHFARRFATGLVTGNADDVASLSGTVAGDLEASKKITIRKGGRLVGDLRTPGIIIEEGAYFKGKIEIVDSEEQPQASGTEPEIKKASVSA